jgi:histidinol-phosphate aminotransferase
MLPTRFPLADVHSYRIPERERAGLLRLDINERPSGAPEFVVSAVREALTSQALATYPVYAQWQTVAAQAYGVRPTELTCSNGGDEALRAICEVFLVRDLPLVTHDPGYDMFRIWSQLLGNPFKPVALGTGFGFDMEAWQAALPGAGLVALVSPSNPTGTVVPRAAMEATLAAVQCPVVVDETYADFTGASVVDLIGQHPHLFVVRSFSKAHGVAGLRAGVVLSQAQNIDLLRKHMNPFNVNRAAVAAMTAVLGHPEATQAHVAEVNATRQRFVRELASMGVSTGPAHANFVLADFGGKAGKVTTALAAEGILVRDRTGSHPRLQGQVRIGIGSPAQMQRCAGALRKVLQAPPRLRALLFDLDGPLVDVSHSYRQAILETARAFLPAELQAEASPARVEQLKRRGGLNNDWHCTAALLAELGHPRPLDEVVTAFQARYWGSCGDGLIAREPWLLPLHWKSPLSRWKTGIVTGRPRQEALFTLRKQDWHRVFGTVVAMEDAPAKPAPDGLIQALGEVSANAHETAYLGDSVDDMRAAVAAGVLPVGVLPAQASWGDGLAEKLYEAGAHAVFASVEEVLRWLAAPV